MKRCTRGFLFVVIFSLLALSANSQVNKDSLAYKKIFEKKSALFVRITAGFAQKAITHKTSGPYSIYATPQPMWEAGFEYRFKLHKNLFLITGLKGSFIGRNVVADLPINKVNPEYSESYPLKAPLLNLIAAVPLLVEYNWNVNSKKSAFVQGGIDFRYSLGYDIDDMSFTFRDTNGNQVNVLEVNTYSNNDAKPFITLNLGGGYEWRLKNHNLLKAGLTANISFTKYVNGTYEVNIPGEAVSTGTYGVTGSFLALQVSYGFTGTNRRLVRYYENRR